MRDNKIQGLLIIACGLIIIGAGLFIYFVAHSIYPDSGSSRVQDMNQLLKFFGKTGLTILVCTIGLIAVFRGMYYFRKKR